MNPASRPAAFLLLCAVLFLSIPAAHGAPNGAEIQGSMPAPTERYTYVPVSGKSFAKAFRVEVAEKTKNPWDLQASVPTAGAVADGDTVAIVVETRVKSGEGLLGLKLQDGGYKTILRGDVKCGPEWKMQIVVDTIKGAFASGELSLALFLGMAKQELEFGPIRIINFGKSAKPADITPEALAAATIKVKDEGAALKAMAMPPAYSKWGNTLDFPAKDSALSMRYLNEADIDKNGFVFVKDGHFHNKAGQVRFLGVNLTFDSMFPERAQAEKVAFHLSGLGVNCVRIHHIDNRHIWGKYQDRQEQFDPDQLEKMDYLVAQLKKNGIYVNLNLHVSWNYQSTKDYDYRAVISSNPAFKYGKGIDNVMPELIEMQKRYAADLLGHVNPHTRLAYKDDPAVALVEINNENAFFRFVYANGALDALPENFRDVVRKKWQAWLTAKYGAFPALVDAWAKGIPRAARAPMEGVMPFSAANGWATEVVNPNHGAITLAGQTLEVESKTDDRSSFFQVMKTGLTFAKGEDYTVILEIKGKKGSLVGVNAMFDRAPWTGLGLGANLPITSDDFAEYVVGFKAREDAPACGRVTLRGFTGGNRFTVRSIRVEKGAYVAPALAQEKSFGELALPPLGRLSILPPALRTDFITFLHDMELAYWKDMMAFVKKAGVRVPVTGTQLDYSYIDIAYAYDYVDRHAYWKHPSFPGKPWDGNNYYVQNVSMLGSPQNTLTGAIIPDRVKGLPYTSSEYDHAYPNEYCGESAPFISVASALHDHDGFFFFDFGSTSGTIGYFDYFNNFAKKHLLPFAAAIFRTGKVAPLANDLTLTISKANMFSEALNGVANPFARLMPVSLVTGGRVSIRVGDNPRSPAEEIAAQTLKVDPRIEWNCATNDYKESLFKLDDPNGKLVMAFAKGSETWELGALTLSSVSSPGGNFIFSAFNKNGAVGEKGVYLITLASRNRYENVEYLEYTKRDPLPAGDNHGAKVMAKSRSRDNVEYVECLGATVKLALKEAPASATAYAIDNLGLKAAEVPVTRKGNVLTLSPARKYGTIVYVLEVK